MDSLSSSAPLDGVAHVHCLPVISSCIRSWWGKSNHWLLRFPGGWLCSIICFLSSIGCFYLVIGGWNLDNKSSECHMTNTSGQHTHFPLPSSLFLVLSNSMATNSRVSQTIIAHSTSDFFNTASGEMPGGEKKDVSSSENHQAGWFSMPCWIPEGISPENPHCFTILVGQITDKETHPWHGCTAAASATLGPEILRRAGFEAKDRAAGLVWHRTMNHGPYYFQSSYLVFIHESYIYIHTYIHVYIYVNGYVCM